MRSRRDWRSGSWRTNPGPWKGSPNYRRTVLVRPLDVARRVLPPEVAVHVDARVRKEDRAREPVAHFRVGRRIDPGGRVARGLERLGVEEPRVGRGRAAQLEAQQPAVAPSRPRPAGRGD